MNSFAPFAYIRNFSQILDWWEILEIEHEFCLLRTGKSAFAIVTQKSTFTVLSVMARSNLSELDFISQTKNSIQIFL